MENLQQEKPVMPKTWVVQAFLVTFLCFWPTGIADIIYATKVEGYFLGGLYDKAAEASARARKYVMISFWIGIAVFALVVTVYTIIIIAALTGGLDSHGFYDYDFS